MDPETFGTAGGTCLGFLENIASGSRRFPTGSTTGADPRQAARRPMTFTGIGRTPVHQDHLGTGGTVSPPSFLLENSQPIEARACHHALPRPVSEPPLDPKEKTTERVTSLDRDPVWKCLLTVSRSWPNHLIRTVLLELRNRPKKVE
jgi:hypothetical protein